MLPPLAECAPTVPRNAVHACTTMYKRGRCEGPAGDIRLARVNAAGGDPEFLSPDTLDFVTNWPQVLPGARGVLFRLCRGSRGNCDPAASLAVLDLETREVTGRSGFTISLPVPRPSSRSMGRTKVPNGRPTGRGFRSHQIALARGSCLSSRQTGVVLRNSSRLRS